ncbi:MAG: phosphoribosylformylglycinamidine synthase [Selenomonadaceae bacterium]|nr:phosphoribosylformylglycinamidine synthase [Selenomonadaceae bacterium]
MVKRIFVEKRAGFDIPAQNMLEDFRETIGIKNLKSLRLFVRYDIEDLSDEDFLKVRDIVFREPNVDNFFEELPKEIDLKKTFAVEYLPGQFDQRADSAAQCVQLVTGKERPIIHSAQVIFLDGEFSDEDFQKIKSYSINAIESREAKFDLPKTLKLSAEIPADVEIISDFNNFSDEDLKKFLSERGFAMSFDDLKFCQKYFREKNRPPTITELKVIDTYWSDHCRHTTFNTVVDEVTFADGKYKTEFEETYKNYLAERNPEKDISLMDLGTIAAKILKRDGILKNLDESEEINACSIKISADVDGRKEDWLIMFKNETHNHPTEIEPFGGAATCLGGAIRDPLSGRSYVYQAMRVTGAADPRKKLSETLPGKLPQKKIVRGAAQGYSSYGNQIGLATGQVKEIYHEGYLAKRMEIGAVIAAAPAENVVREKPVAGDVVILLGGRTGRDGIGGATGSSKVHTAESLTKSGAEVQKGNAPTERKIQRLFRNPKVSRLIKRCNDFGAGGVAVAVGELAEGLKINLDAVRKKYDGLDGTELAISESQERMAVVLNPADVENFIKFADEENLEAYKVAEVTDDKKLVMTWRDKKIVEVDRNFFDTNGVKQHVKVHVAGVEKYLQTKLSDDVKTSWIENLQKLNVCSQKGLVERFDSTIGASTILMPFGGKNQLTPAEGMAAKIPVEGETKTATVMTFGFDAKISEWSPYHGAVDAVTSSLAKLTAMGADFSQAYLSFQEYFERLEKVPEKWGKPFAALLGAFKAQKNFGVAAIGGKDSMSGTFEKLNVPPTLVSFAVAPCDADKIISPEFKNIGSKIYLVECARDEFNIPVFKSLKKKFAKVHEYISAGKIISAASIGVGGIAEAVSKMAIGNDIGFKFFENVKLFQKNYGSLILEAAENVELDFLELGETISEQKILFDGGEISLDEIKNIWSEPLEKIFPTKVKNISDEKISNSFYRAEVLQKSKIKTAKPKIFIPVFPGTNCEYDSAKAWRNAGGNPKIFVIRNLTPQAVEESISAMVEEISKSQIIMLPGGFSGGDEPDGSGKFIAAMFRNPKISEEVMKLLKDRDGLILGICNGFQALIKLGLLPYGEICELEKDSPTLTHNNLGRHVSQFVRTRITSNLSPWLAGNSVGDVHNIAVSHGEGRFSANPDWLKKLSDAGQIATQYVDLNDEPTNNLPFNPNGSAWAIEGITDATGKIFGKMGHSERIGENVCKNISGEKNQKLFEAGVNYFS